MNNLILHLLSNRQGPFNEPLFGQNPNFTPTIVPDAEQTLRNLLFLNKTETDYYLKVYLAVLNSYFEWHQQFGIFLPESYRPEELMPKGIYMRGADLTTNYSGTGFFADPPVNTLPVELHYLITYLADNMCQISGTETNTQYTATVATTGSDPNKVLRITWPTVVPFVGALELSQNWVEGAGIDIFIQPSRFPFRQLIDNLQGNQYLQTLLLNYDISAEFNESADPMEQTAMALTVLGLTNEARVKLIHESRVFSINADQTGWLTTS